MTCTVFKKICDHPCLLTSRQIIELDILDPVDDFRGGVTEEILDKAPSPEILAAVNLEKIIDMCGKFKFLLPLLEELTSDGHRVLLFSLTKTALSIIERCLKKIVYFS